MKTTININGLDVEFTDQKPTRPGALWFLPKSVGRPFLSKLKEDGSIETPGCIYEPWFDFRGCLFSAPLVPVTEVENAYREGMSDLAVNMNPFPPKTPVRYETSRARKVVEGVQ